MENQLYANFANYREFLKSAAAEKQFATFGARLCAPHQPQHPHQH